MSIRKDGRDTMQLRPITLSVGQIAGAGGSAKCRSGGTCVMALLYGPATAKTASERYDQAIVQVSIQRTSSSSSSASSSNGSGITTAASTGAAKLLAAYNKKRIQAEDNRIASVIRRILMTTVLDVAKFPRCVVAVTVQVLQDDGSLEACCVNAVMAAVLDSAIPCKLTVAAVTVGTLKEAPKNIKPSGDSAIGGEESNDSSNNLLMLDLTSFEEEQFISDDENKRNEEITEEEQSKRMTLALRSKGTFVIGFPASSGGVVAVSDFLVSPCAGSTNNSVDSSLALMSNMEKAANAASVRLFDIFRSSCCGNVVVPNENEQLQQD